MSSPHAERRDRPTMRDVAALAGVGIKTVSRVVNDVPSVAPDLAERVRNAADKLGYRPNLTASSLRRSDRRTNTIALLVDDVSNPYAATALRGIEDFFRPRDVLVLAASLDDDAQRERDLARTLIDRRVDGLIVMAAAGQDHRYLVTEQEAGAHFVFIDRQPTPLIADAVVSDNRGGARQAVEHLLGSGTRRRVVYLGDRGDIPTAVERLEGFRDAMTAAGRRIDDVLIRVGVHSEENAYEVVARMLADDAPDAIFSGRNAITIGAVRALHDAGLQHQVAFVGFDDIPLAELLRPGITVMAQDPYAIATRAAQRLFERMGGDVSPPRVETVPTRLVVRGSGEIGRDSSG